MSQVSRGPRLDFFSALLPDSFSYRHIHGPKHRHRGPTHSQRANYYNGNHRHISRKIVPT